MLTFIVIAIVSIDNQFRGYPDVTRFARVTLVNKY